MAWNRGIAQDPAQESTPAPDSSSLASSNPACRFALALPELEGPLTLGIFAPDGHLVRLLYRDASIDTLPAGLNGLLITWDGNDDMASRVPPGVYRARGLVHGKIPFTPIPGTTQEVPPPVASPTLPFFSQTFAVSTSYLPLSLISPSNRITVRAAQDALLANRPLLSITATVEGNQAVLLVEGLPLLSIPLTPSLASANKPIVELHHGKSVGSAELILISSGVRTSYLISGLDQLVPLNAGDLPMPPQVFHPDDSATPDPGKPRS